MDVDQLLVEIASLSSRALEVRAESLPPGPLKESLEARARLSLLRARMPMSALSKDPTVPVVEAGAERVIRLALWLFENDPEGHESIESAIEKARRLWFNLLNTFASEPLSSVSPNNSAAAEPDPPLPPVRGGQ